MVRPGGRHETCIQVSPDHPALPGHFPGTPIVPGVLLLEQVLAAAETWLCCTLAPTGLPQVKFLTPLLPGEEATLRLELADATLEFMVSGKGKKIAAGIFTLGDLVEAAPGIKSGSP